MDFDLSAVKILGLADLPYPAGLKVSGIQALKKSGFLIPDGFILPSSVHLDTQPDAELASLINKIGGYPVAVRFNYSSQDYSGSALDNYSLTTLNIEDFADLKQAIAKIQSALQDEKFYSRILKENESSPEIRPQIIVQRMVPAKISGVGYTINPTSVNEDEILIECCSGYGDRLANGKVYPNSYKFHLTQQNIMDQQKGEDPIELSRTQLKILSQEFLNIQALFGCPQRIDWVLDQSDRLWILQTLPLNGHAKSNEYVKVNFQKNNLERRPEIPLLTSFRKQALMEVLNDQYYIQKNSAAAKAGGKMVGEFFARTYWAKNSLKPRFSPKKFSLLSYFKPRIDSFSQLSSYVQSNELYFLHNIKQFKYHSESEIRRLSRNISEFKIKVESESIKCHLKFLNLKSQEQHAALSRQIEAAQFLSRSSHVVRQWALSLGEHWLYKGWLTDVDDIFFLEISNLLAALDGEISPSTVARLITEKKIKYLGFRNFDPPDQIREFTFFNY